MKSLSSILGLIVFVAATSGCATVTPLPSNPAANGQAKTIGLLKPSSPEELAVHRGVPAGSNVGHAGTSVDAGAESSNRSPFSEAMHGKALDKKPVLREHVKYEVQDGGYPLRPVLLFRPAGDLIEKYPPSDGSADACLDPWTTFVIDESPSATTPYYRPLGLHCKVMAVKDNAVVMHDP